jgi:hypothetical protein
MPDDDLRPAPACNHGSHRVLARPEGCNPIISVENHNAAFPADLDARQFIACLARIGFNHHNG